MAKKSSLSYFDDPFRRVTSIMYHLHNFSHIICNLLIMPQNYTHILIEAKCGKMFSELLTFCNSWCYVVKHFINHVNHNIHSNYLLFLSFPLFDVPAEVTELIERDLLLLKYKVYLSICDHFPFSLYYAKEKGFHKQKPQNTIFDLPHRITQITNSMRCYAKTS